MIDLNLLADIGIKAALAAGEIIQQYTDKDITVDRKTGGNSDASQVVTIVDKAAEEVILSFLLPTCSTFDLALLSEETEDDGSRFMKEHFWCIDPLDGTLTFIEKRPGFSVSIALVSKDGTPLIGIVYDPSTNMLYHAIKGYGAFKNHHPWTINHKNNHITYVTDRKLDETPRNEEIMKYLEDAKRNLNLHSIVEMHGGGAVLNAIRVVENGPACMLKFPKKENGGGSIWDYAATACIFSELRLYATDFSGGRLDLNRLDGTFMNSSGVLYLNM